MTSKSVLKREAVQGKKSRATYIVEFLDLRASDDVFAKQYGWFEFRKWVKDLDIQLPNEFTAIEDIPLYSGEWQELRFGYFPPPFLNVTLYDANKNSYYNQLGWVAEDGVWRGAATLLPFPEGFDKPTHWFLTPSAEIEQ